MDLTQIYMTSPDWIKALLVVTPCLTVFAIACLFRPRHMPVKAEHAWGPVPRQPLLPTPVHGIDEEELRYFALLLAESSRSRLSLPEPSTSSTPSGNVSGSAHGHVPGLENSPLPPER